MIDVIELCRSSNFLAGGAADRERRFDFPAVRAWKWRITDVHAYVRAITPNEEERTTWHLLEEQYLSDVRTVIDTIYSAGAGAILEELEIQRGVLSDLLSTSTQIRSLSSRIGVTVGIDGERLLDESLGEMPYGHLSAAMWIQQLCPEVAFPVITVLLDAYAEGLLPYGVFTGRLDRSYSGPNSVVCLDPSLLLTPIHCNGRFIEER